MARRSVLLRLVSHYLNGTMWQPAKWGELVRDAGLPWGWRPAQACRAALAVLNDPSMAAPSEATATAQSILIDPANLQTQPDHHDPRMGGLLAALQRPWPNVMHALYVHGSIADGGVVGYSDADLVMVVDSAAGPEDLRVLRKRVQEASRAILRFQPDQHHGIQIIPSSLAQSMTNGDMPVAVARSLRCIVDQTETRVIRIKRHDEALDSAAALAAKVANATKARSSYGAMMLLSQVMLLPALEHRVLGNDYSKIDALRLWEDAGGTRAAAVRMASAARAAWPTPESDIWALLFGAPINPWVVSAVRRRWGPAPAPELDPYLDGSAISEYRRAGHLVLDLVATRTAGR
jgi:hypothetical protein